MGYQWSSFRSFDEDNEADEYLVVETWLQRAVASGGGVARVDLKFIHPQGKAKPKAKSCLATLCYAL
jgi:hypothetical protein